MVPFDIEIIRNALSQHGWAIERLAQCSSTNGVLMERARRGERDRVVLVTEEQTAGRGRRGAAWISPPGAGLTFSLLWQSRRSVGHFGLIPIAAGVACARALERVGAPTVGLKWPNDLVVAGAKLGGILVEFATGEPGFRTVPGRRTEKTAAVVIGIGINLRQGRSLSARLARPVTDLAAVCDPLPSAERVLIEVLGEMHASLSAFESNCDDQILVAWSEYDVLFGRPIEIDAAGSVIRGTARGLASDGALKVDTPQGMQRVYSGDVSISS